MFAVPRATGQALSLVSPGATIDQHRHRHRAPDTRPRGARQRWTVPVPGNVFGAPAFVGSSHVVVNVRGPGREGTVRALDLEDGHPVWEHRLGANSNVTPVVEDGVVIVAGEDGAVVGLDARNGAVIWQVALGGPIEGSPLVLEDAVLVGVGLTRRPAGPGRVARISRSGVVAWQVEMDASVPAGPTSFDQRRALVATARGTVHLVHTDDGELRDLVVPAESDHDETDAPIIGSPVRAPALRLPGVSVLLATSGTVLAIGDDGNDRWSWTSSSPVVAGELATDGTHVFVPGSDGRLLALDAHTGDRAWHLERLGRRGTALWSSPVVIGDAAMAVCSTGELVAVSVTDGAELFSLAIDGEPVAAPLDGDDHGRFVVASLGQEQRVTCWELVR